MLNCNPQLVIVRFLCLLVPLMWVSGLTLAQREVTYSIGVFGGFTSTFTYDEGINQDSRYQTKYNARFVPGGIHAGIDFDGYGFMIDPQLTQVGQSFNIVNITGGQVGERVVSQSYLQIPFSFKKHIIDLSFFKVSWVFGISYAQLLSADERVSHESAKLAFPLATYPILESPEYVALGYIVEYDGVASPATKNLITLKKSDFRKFQVFGSVGVRSDWDVTDNARLSIDLRGNVGLFDPRSDDYLKRADNNETVYEIGGKRRDFFASLTIGYSRYLFVEKRAKVKKVTPFQYYGPKRRTPKTGL
jgi:hypothetical protein